MLFYCWSRLPLHVKSIFFSQGFSTTIHFTLNFKKQNIMENKTQNIAENNKLIAEFMNYEWYEVNKPHIAVRQPNGGVRHFQTDWNDLMEVVEKIESLGYTFLTLKSPSYLTYIEKDIFKANQHKGIANTKIESIYNACVEFIKWYNKQK